MSDPDLDLLDARVAAIRAARRAQRGELPMYEHGVAVKAEEPIPYRVTAKGWEAYRERYPGQFERLRDVIALVPPTFDEPCDLDGFGWDANGSFVEVERKA